MKRAAVAGAGTRVVSNGEGDRRREQGGQDARRQRACAAAAAPLGKRVFYRQSTVDELAALSLTIQRTPRVARRAAAAGAIVSALRVHVVSHKAQRESKRMQSRTHPRATVTLAVPCSASCDRSAALAHSHAHTRRAPHAQRLRVSRGGVSAVGAESCVHVGVRGGAQSRAEQNRARRAARIRTHQHRSHGDPTTAAGQEHASTARVRAEGPSPSRSPPLCSVAQVRFAPSASSSESAYSWDALAEALVSIANGKAKADGRTTRMTQPQQRGSAAAGAAAGNGFDRASQNAPPSHARIRSPLRSGGRGSAAAAALKSPHAAAASSSPTAAAAAAAEPLPTGMQLLCSVAWTQVHSPPPVTRAQIGGASGPRTPQQQSQQLWSPFASPARSPVPMATSASPFVSPSPSSAAAPFRRAQMMSPPPSSSSSAYARPSPAAAAAAASHFRSPNRFTAPSSDDEEEDDDEYSDRSDAASSEDESDRSREEVHSRMQADSTLDFGSAAHQATLADLTAVAQRMPRAFDPSVFHSASFSVDAATRSPSSVGRRAAGFVMRQPVLRADSSADMDDEAAAGPAEPTARADADSLTSLELEYEHLQSALHSLQQHYSEQLAREIEQKVCELDVALALTLGVEPEPSVLDRLTESASGDSGSSTSSVLAHSRELAAQHQVATLPQTLYARHAASLARFRSHYAPVAEEYRKSLSDLQASMVSNESKLSAILDRNHLEVTRKRDEQVRAAIAAAKAAEEARLKKLEEERLAKEAADKAKAEAEAAAKKAAEEAAAKKAADKDAKDKSDAASAAAAAGKAAAASAAAVRPAAGPAVAGPSPAAAQEMAARIAHLTSCRASFAGFVSSAEMKPARLKIMMAINRAIQQISGTLLQVQSKARELLTLLGMAKAASVNSGGDQYHYCLDLIATKIVAQAYAKVRLMHDAAFPFAKVALMIALGQYAQL